MSSDDLPAPALQKRMGGASNAMKGMMSNFGNATAAANNNDDDFSPLDAVSLTPTSNGGVGLSVNPDAAQRLATVAAAGAANSYLQQKSFGMVGLGGGDNGAGGLTIGGLAPSDLSSMKASDVSRMSGGTASNFLQSRTGGIVSFNEGAEGGAMSGLMIGGKAATDFTGDAAEMQRAATGAAGTYLQNKTGGLMTMSGVDGQGNATGAPMGLTLGGNAAGALTKGMDPISGALATGAANMMLNEKTGGMLSLNSAGNLQLKSNEHVDRRLQEARAAATVAGTSVGNTFAAGAAAVGLQRLGGGGGDSNGDTAMVDMRGESAGPAPGTVGGGGGAVFDVARSEFQARWARAVEEEERLRMQSLDVDRRERQLAMRSSKQAPNFPPIRMCGLGPVVHHDIAGCIPKARQLFVKACYGTFYGTVLMLIANMVLISVNVGTCGREKLANGDDTTFLKHLILPIIYMVLGGVGAFFVWYHPVYSACGTGSSMAYVKSYIGLAVGFAFSVFLAVGPEGYGGAGFIYALAVADRCGSSNFLMLVPIAVLWACHAVCMFAYVIRLRTFYKEDEASLDAARDQLKAQMR